MNINNVVNVTRVDICRRLVTETNGKRHLKFRVMKEQLIELANSGLNLDLFYSIRVHKGETILQGHLNAETLQALNGYHFTFDNESQQMHSTDHLEFSDNGNTFRIVLV